MTTFKIYKDAEMRNLRHDTGQKTLDHDGIVCMIIRKMRKLGMRLIDYDETPDNHPTIMKFEDRKGTKDGYATEISQR
jgi:hypothetical protein